MAMTESAQEVEALRALDADVALKVMGWRRAPCGLHRDCAEAGFKPGAPFPAHFPHFSTNLLDAWKVVEKIAARNGDTIVSVTRNGGDGERMGGEAKYFCTIEDVSDGIEEWEASADTAPLAICKAALKVVEQSQPAGA